MTLSEYKELAKTDLPKVDLGSLDEESIRTAPLHQKYLNFYLYEKGVLEKLTVDFKRLRLQQKLIYSGRAGAEKCKQWAQVVPHYNPNINILKTELDEWLEVDPLIIPALEVCQEQEKVVEFLERTIRENIMQRGYSISYAQKFLNFKFGVQ